MDLKKLYGDCAVLCQKEPPLYAFFVHLDMGVRTLLSRYPKKLLFSDRGIRAARRAFGRAWAARGILSAAALLYRLKKRRGCGA